MKQWINVVPPARISKTLRAIVPAVGLMLSLSHAPDANASLSLISRANCGGFNESISWDPWGYNWLWTDSYHYYNGWYQHLLRSGWAYTWRSYAGEQFEGYGGWTVYGVHYRWDPSIGTYWMGSTAAVDCNLLSW